jgi:hypothetical protein
LAAGQLGNDDEFPEFESGGNNLYAELRQVVLVSVAHFLDEAVEPKPLQQARDLATVLAPQESAERLVLHSADVELAAGDDAEEGFVVAIKEIEAGVGPALPADRLRQLFEFVAAIPRIFDRG